MAIRLEKQRVTTLGTGVDSTVQSIKTAWDTLGRLEKVTSYSDNNCTTAVNEVIYEYDDFGALSKEYQEHEGVKDNDTLYVGYTHASTALGYRLTGVRYPNARSITYLYGAPDSVATSLSLLSSIVTGGSVASYSYNGAGRMVIEDFPEPDVRLDYWGQTADTYDGFDRFGLVKEQLWRDYGASADRDKYTYGHDRNSNRLYRENTVTNGKDELYTYDHLNRLTTVDRGDLDNDKDEIPVADRVKGEAWGLSPVGNWDDYQVDSNGDGDFTDADDLDQGRTHNLVNEITDITEQADPQQEQWATPAWSARGNMTTAPKPADMTDTMTCTYDAWNRLVEVKDGETVIQKNEYDGTNRRIKVHVDTQAPGNPNGVDTYRHFFYNNSWQIVETRKSTTENTEPEDLEPEYQYVWSMRYIDAPVLRDKNTDDDGTCDDERIYYTTDANMNVTCLVDTDGDALERYIYDAYGTPTVLDADWSVDGDGVSDYANNVLFAGYYYGWETGLYHVRNRMYHAELGRWMQRDPIGYANGMSLYEYAWTTPAVAVDPSGLGDDLQDVVDALLEDYGQLAQALIECRRPAYVPSHFGGDTVGWIVMFLKAGGAYGDKVLNTPLAASFLEHALRPETRAEIDSFLEVEHKQESDAVRAIIADDTYRESLQNVLEAAMTGTRDKLSCENKSATHRHKRTAASTNFAAGDLHYAIGKITFAATGDCTLTMECKEGVCCRVNYVCQDIKIEGRDRYDFAWDPAGTAGAMINNMAYVAQEHDKLGNYTNIFSFKDSFSGEMPCPSEGEEK